MTAEASTNATEKLWPGSPDGSCPECGVLQDGWDMHYHVAKIGSFGIMPVEEKLVGVTCPNCKTKFKVADPS